MLPKWSADLSLYGLLKEFSRENRQHETEAEGILWSYIRNKQLGVKFLRQFIVDKYILDFVCRETKLVIEVDGAYHAERQQKEDDALRTLDLQRLGYRVIRFTNDQVLFDIENVIRQIKVEI